MTTDGTDISAFQPTTPNLAGDTFGIVKATEGIGWESPVWRGQVATLRNLHDGVGYYHFCNGLNTPQAEADYFWNTIKDVWQVGEPIALDVEGDFFNHTADPVGWVLACARELKALSGLTAVFYSDWSHVKGPYNWQPLVDFNMGLWGAAYNGTGFGDPSPWPLIFCWQNADTNISGGDSDVLYGDLTTWRAYGTPGTIQPANGGNVTPIITEDPMFLAKLANDPKTYLSNGVWYRYIDSPDTLNAIVAATGISGTVQTVPSLAVLGVAADQIPQSVLNLDLPRQGGPTGTTNLAAVLEWFDANDQAILNAVHSVTAGTGASAADVVAAIKAQWAK